MAKSIPSAFPSFPTPPNREGEVLRRAKANYLAQILALIERAKVYPFRARVAGYQGGVSLSFVLEPDGRVREIKVLKSSGYELLDRAAVKTILRASPFPPPPPELSPPLTLSVKISFVLKE